MSISGIDSLQAPCLQNVPGNSYSGNASAFSNLLLSMLETQGSDNTAQQYVTPHSDSTYALLSCLLRSGMDSSMMLMSLGNALFGEGTSSLYGAVNPFSSIGQYGAIGAAITGSGLQGTGNIPAEPWKPTDPALTSNVFNRSPQLYTEVIKQFSVETNERYQPDGGTYCNIFVWDVTSAMGAEIPHYYDADTGAPMKYGDKGANQMNANAMYKWLHEYGDQYGWFEVTPKEAQELANDGHPVVTALFRNGPHGHVQVVCPSKDGVYDEERGVTIAQAGTNLTSYRPITKIYNASLPKVSYFAHM